MTVEILFRAYVVAVVWHAWSYVQSEREKLSNKPPDDIESASSAENPFSEQLEVAEDPRLEVCTRFIEQRSVERF